MSIKYRNVAKYAAQGKRCMRLNDVASYLSVSKSYVNRLIKLGKFPVGINIGANLSSSGRLVVWEKVTVDQWLDQQMGGK
ncbi:MAG: AlpA family phage regulatory protein [Candidatus Marinimicrobia bacterium]|jgi:predicted DNA-binding transcriptional regulator AlpA|nr:AlpA family phage regulatory protein [Candidatus Neomarinimicrobiota bacterium]